jgi:hypothetical protein
MLNQAFGGRPGVQAQRKNTGLVNAHCIEWRHGRRALPLRAVGRSTRILAMRIRLACALAGGLLSTGAACSSESIPRRLPLAAPEHPLGSPTLGAVDVPPKPDERACPAPGAVPEALPHKDYTIDGTRFFDADVRAWKWTISGGPCDELFAGEGKPTSFTVTGTDTASPTFRPTATGDYNVQVTVETTGGEELRCAFALHVAGVGLRVELCWDGTGTNSLDLHLHAPYSTAPWYPIPNNDECGFANCSGFAFPHVDWAYAPSPLSECENGRDGEWWRALGSCSNPRLDFDNIAEPGVSENINIDVPEDGASYRVMAAYADGSGPRSPIANVYCQGHLVASFGRAPDTVPGFDTPGEISGSSWRVADVRTHVDENRVTTCDVTALHPAGQSTGYDVRKGDARY